MACSHKLLNLADPVSLRDSVNQGVKFHPIVTYFCLTAHVAGVAIFSRVVGGSF